MSRPIDADALADKVADLYTEGENATEGDKVVNAVIDLIDNAPTVDIKAFANITFDKNELEQIVRDKVIEPIKNGELVVKSEWILISERLPDYMDDILITFQKPNREPLVYRAIFVDGKFNLDNGDTWNWNDPEIKAWMPLPEAYKE